MEHLISRIEYRELAPGESLELQDLPESGPLIVVTRGAVCMKVGDEPGPGMARGPGTVLNSIGFHKIGIRVDHMRPTSTAAKSDDSDSTPGPWPSIAAQGYEVWGYTGKPPRLFQERRSNGALSRARTSLAREPGPQAPAPPGAGTKGEATLSENARCFYNLCPCAAHPPREAEPWLPLLVEGAAPGDFPSLAGPQDPELFAKGGATVAFLHPSPTLGVAVNPLGRRASRPNNDPRVDGLLALLAQNVETYAIAWIRLMETVGRFVLPRAPAHAMWSLAELAHTVQIPPGHAVVEEDDQGEQADALFIVAHGEAIVEKKVCNSSAAVTTETLGRLRKGAIIGGVCLIGASVPRAATARAKIEVEALEVPLWALVEFLGLYPGLLAGCKDGLLESAEFVRGRLLPKAEMAGSLALFSHCNESFLEAIASIGNRRVYLCGEAVVEEGDSSGTLSCLELGQCAIEVRGRGRVGQVPAGNCFGERTFLGISKAANATVRVITPYALVFAVPRSAFVNEVLPKHPDERRRFKRAAAGDTGYGLVKGSKVKCLGLFQSCGPDFLQSIDASVQTVGYMPGQTIVVEQDDEADPSMFVLTGGMAVAEKNGVEVAKMPKGASFGEPVMLGYMERRSATIRAQTFCFVRGIRRSDFFKSLRKFPDEEASFAKLLSKGVSCDTKWPCFPGVSHRLVTLLDLCATSGEYKESASGLGRLPRDTAVLVTKGSVALMTREGGEVVEVLEKGQCFNEQILAGVHIGASGYLVPTTDCEVRLLTRNGWAKVLAELPAERRAAQAAILRYKAETAEKKMGHTPGGVGVFLNTDIFQVVSAAFTQWLRDRVKTRLFEPGEFIFQVEPLEGKDPAMYLLLEGEATLETAFSQEPAPLGGVYGEAVMLGMASTYSGTLQARSLCTVQVLRRSLFDAALELFDPEKELFSKLRGALPTPAGLEDIRYQLLRTRRFRTAPKEFAAVLLRSLDIVYFAAGKTVIKQGELCGLGRSPLYFILAGRVQAEGRFGTIFGSSSAGELFGEWGALGFGDTRSASSRAAVEVDLVCCCQVPGAAVAAAIAAHPGARAPLLERFGELEDTNAKAEHMRCRWLEEVAVPALLRTPLLRGCPSDFVFSVCAQLYERKCPKGTLLVEVGDAVPGMLVLLRGRAEVEAKSGTKVGQLKEGSTFGELSALGLFSTCMATVRALSECRVLTMPEQALRMVLRSASPAAASLSTGFACLVKSRQDQLERGLPLSGLQLGAAADDVFVRAIALLAERLDLCKGQAWPPVSDDDPNGPCLSILIRGRACVEMPYDAEAPGGTVLGGASGASGAPTTPVTVLRPGSIVHEGLIAEYGASSRAATDCEVYRIRRSDMGMVINSSATSQECQWVWTFKMQEKEAAEHLKARLQSVRGMHNGRAPRHAEGLQLTRAQKGTRLKGISDVGQDRTMTRLPPVGPQPALHAVPQAVAQPEPHSGPEVVVAADALSLSLSFAGQPRPITVSFRDAEVARGGRGVRLDEASEATATSLPLHTAGKRGAGLGLRPLAAVARCMSEAGRGLAAYPALRLPLLMPSASEARAPRKRA